MRGRVCLITGATSGIGLWTAAGIAKAGGNVIMVGRDGVKGGEALAEVEALVGTSGGRVSLLLADLASLSAIRRLADDVKSQHSQLHVLINNAGAINQHRTLTKDGFETTFGVNHLAYFLLTELLRPLLAKSGQARIINVASEAHRRGAIDFDDLQLEKSWAAWKSYSSSKLMNVMHTYALARRLAGTETTANCLHPGVIASGFGKNNAGLMKLLWTIGSPFLMTAEKGAKTSVYLATSDEVAGKSGGYYKDSRPIRSSAASYDEAAQERLWADSSKLVGL